MFFGREVLTDQLLQRLAEDSFLAVVGASGSGKSSLVRAGVLPALRQGDRPPTLLYIMTPGAHPLETLAVTLTCDAERVADIAHLLDDLAHEPRTLRLWARRQLAELPNGHWRMGRRYCWWLTNLKRSSPSAMMTPSARLSLTI